MGAAAPVCAWRSSLGDDLTDCTGFAAVHEWADEGEAATAGGDAPAGRVALAVAALTGETPQRVTDEADVVVAATPGVYEVLTALLAAVRA